MSSPIVGTCLTPPQVAAPLFSESSLTENGSFWKKKGEGTTDYRDTYSGPKEGRCPLLLF